MQNVLQMIAPDENDGQIDLEGVNKGGGGKTTTLINKAMMQTLAGVLSLVVDCAPEAHATYSFGYWPHQIEYSIYDLLLGKCTLRECIVPTYYSTQARSFFCPTEQVEPSDPQSPTLLEQYRKQKNSVIRGPDLIPMKLLFNQEVTSSPDEDLRGKELRELLLAFALQPARKMYTKIDLDINPDLLNVLTVNALYAADNVIIPFVPDPLTAIGIKNMLDAINRVRRLNSKLRIAGILLSKVREQKAHREIIGPFRENMARLNTRIFETIIMENSVKFLNASNKRSVVVLDDPLCDSSIQFWTFLAELVAVTGGPAREKVLRTCQGIIHQRQMMDEERIKRAHRNSVSIQSKDKQEIESHQMKGES